MLHPRLLLREVGARIAKRFRTNSIKQWSENGSRRAFRPKLVIDTAWKRVWNDFGALGHPFRASPAPSWRSWPPLGRLLAASGALWERSWGLLGRFLGRFLALWGGPRAPETSQGALGRHFGPILHRFGVDLGLIFRSMLRWNLRSHLHPQRCPTDCVLRSMSLRLACHRRLCAIVFTGRSRREITID